MYSYVTWISSIVLDLHIMYGFHLLLSIDDFQVTYSYRVATTCNLRHPVRLHHHVTICELDIIYK